MRLPSSLEAGLDRIVSDLLDEIDPEEQVDERVLFDDLLEVVEGAIEDWLSEQKDKWQRTKEDATER